MYSYCYSKACIEFPKLCLNGAALAILSKTKEEEEEEKEKGHMSFFSLTRIIHSHLYIKRRKQLFDIYRLFNPKGHTRAPPKMACGYPCVRVVKEEGSHTHSFHLGVCICQRTIAYICVPGNLQSATTTTPGKNEICQIHFTSQSLIHNSIVQELCESRGGRPGLSVPTSLLVSVDVKNYCTVLRHWSQLVPNMSTDIWGH